MEIYDDGGYCFACGWVDKSLADIEAPKREPENLKDTLDYIRKLPRKQVRGLLLPYDETGFYVVWPDNSFYKKRIYNDKTRYLAPKGHRPPLFKYPSQSKTLVLLEGELNCMSLHLALPGPEIAIASPGSASEFARHFENYLLFHDIFAIVDRDPAGISSGIELKTKLLKRGKRVELIAVNPDYNEVLQTEGATGVLKQFKKDLGLQV